jgi:serine/threonine protein kinase
VLSSFRPTPFLMPSVQGHKEWLAEVHFLGVVEHRNLVKLIGYCASQTDRGPQRLLVYEFMPNKTLDDHLFNRAYPVLPWEVRLQIALGAAEGLLYLHEGLELQVPYQYRIFYLFPPVLDRINVCQ